MMKLPVFQNACVFSAIGACVLAVLLQIQVSLFTTESYLGLRVNAADFLLPFAGLFIVFSLWLKKTDWPAWRKPFGYWAVFALCAIMILGCLNGYLVNGAFSTWAVLNKTLGLFILMAYLGLGAWIVRNGHNGFTRRFILWLTIFFILSVIYECVTYFVFWELDSQALGSAGFFFEGFMFNRNAFAFLTICVVLLFTDTVLSRAERSKIETGVLIALWTLLPVVFFFNGSRALWLLLPFVLGVLAIRHKKIFFKKLLPLVFIGTLCVPFIYQTTAPQVFLPFQFAKALLKSKQDNSTSTSTHRKGYQYDDDRLTVLNESLALYRDHPVSGAGLGTILEDQVRRYGETVSAFDNTMLWVLVEMGPFGLWIFVWVYISMLAALIEYGKINPEHKVFIQGAVFVLLAFGVFSLFHEILYSRFFWFIMGMALVIPKPRQAPPTPEVQTTDLAAQNA